MEASARSLRIASVNIDRVTRTEGGRPILDDVSLDIADGELFVLIGPSGSGKSSVLRAVAGLDPVSAGRVRVDGVDVTDTPTAERGISMVFQRTILMDTLTVRRNIRFPLELRGRSRQEIEDRVTAESRALEIEEILDSWPHQISDGHAQLVQLARALVRPPSVFLLDEPLSRLDPPTRERMRRELRTIQSGYGATMLYATNDPDEALAMADRIAVLFDGRVAQVGTPRTIWLDPVDRRVAELLGPIARIPVDVSRAAGGGFWLTAPDVKIRAWAPVLGSVDGGASVGVRPEAIRLTSGGTILGTLGRVLLGGTRTMRSVEIGASTVTAAVDAELEHGARVRLEFDRFHVFDPDGTTLCTVGG